MEFIFQNIYLKFSRQFDQKIMRNKNRVLTVIALYVIITVVYAAFFLFRIENTALLFVLSIGSVAVLSASTIYTIIQSKDASFDKVREKKKSTKLKPPQKGYDNIIEDYFDAMPLIEKYVESEETYEDIPVINKFIFSIFNREELEKVGQLDLSKMDKILFLREMLYFDFDERKILIENMLNNREETDEEIIYIPPKTTIEMKDQIRVYIRSLLEPGEKTKLIIVDTTELIVTVKERVGVLFNYDLNDFLLSTGGILLLKERTMIRDYDIDDDDEIALIPKRK